MKTNKAVFISTLIWLAVLIALLAACKGEGPMGPEGEQGPDGPPGGPGGSGGNVMAFITPLSDQLNWLAVDAGPGSVVYTLTMNGNSAFELPVEATAAVENGLLYAYIIGVELNYYLLPFSVNHDTPIAEDYNYNLSKAADEDRYKIYVTAEVHSPEEEKPEPMIGERSRLKVIVVPASSVNTPATAGGQQPLTLAHLMLQYHIKETDFKELN